MGQEKRNKTKWYLNGLLRLNLGQLKIKILQMHMNIFQVQLFYKGINNLITYYNSAKADI